MDWAMEQKGGTGGWRRGDRSRGEGEEANRVGRSCHEPDVHGQEKQQETRGLIAGEYVSITPPNLAIWLINKSSGSCVFYKGLLGLKL